MENENTPQPKSSEVNDSKQIKATQPSDLPTDESSEVLPKEVAQLLPAGARQSVEMMMQMTGPMPNPVSKKITAEHISKIIDATAASEIRQHEDSKDSRRWLFYFSCLGIGAFLFLVVFLADKNKDLLLELMKLFITFAGGMGAGWGFKSYKDNREE